MVASALLFRYGNRYGVTREGAVLAAEPCCTDASLVKFASLCFITDDGIGGSDAINALGFILEPGPLREDCLPVYNALLTGRYATAVQQAERAGILK